MSIAFVEEAINNTFHLFPRNSSYVLPGFYDLPIKDATFLIAIAIIIFQMQTGFALVQVGILRTKNSVNLMISNIVDFCIAGLAFWIYGFGLLFGRGEWTTPFFGAGDFFADMKFGDILTCQVLTLFFYQMSYGTTSNAIISCAVAERVKLSSYSLLTFAMTGLYGIGAGWVWGEHGWLRNLGAVDLSGGVIHLIGGSAGTVCAWYIGPRIDRYSKGKDKIPMGNTMHALIGLFILWWGWFGFNAGCSYGVTGGKWQYAARGGIGTALATWGAGAASIFYSMVLNKGKVDVYQVINGIISALIMINVSCFLIPCYISIIMGALSAIISISLIPLMDRFEIDDPLCVFSVHWLGSVIGYISVGLFAENPIPLMTTQGRSGLLIGGEWWLFNIQMVAIVSLTLLGFIGGYIIIKIVDKILPIRLNEHDEITGCDIVEHGITPVEVYYPLENETSKSSNIKNNNQVNPPMTDAPNLERFNNIFTFNLPYGETFRNRNSGKNNLAFLDDESSLPKIFPNL